MTLEQVKDALPYDLYEMILMKRLETEFRENPTTVLLNPMSDLLEKDVINGFDKVRILEMIECKSMTMECFADILKVFEKIKNQDEGRYRHFQYMLKYSLLYKRFVTVGRVSTARLLGMCGNHG
jgi:hypothetical protein